MTVNKRQYPPHALAHRPPKILPWLARSAGLNMGQGESLWRAALRDTTATSAQPEGRSAYWRDLLGNLRTGIARASDKWSTRRIDHNVEARTVTAFDPFEVQRQIAEAALAPWTEFLRHCARSWSSRDYGSSCTRG